ncbi:response regulator [Geminicoccaceae bacterium 1502E]|nr:response regulator [Geminicoccaceae bacterium 1502E]
MTAERAVRRASRGRRSGGRIDARGLKRRVVALKRRARHAEAAARARGAFVATLSHEIREPMNAVLGMARLLHETPLDKEQAHYLDAILTSSEALVTLINDVLDLARIDAGKLELEPVDLALRAFLERLRVMLAGRAEAKGLALEFHVDAGLPSVVRADPPRLRQVLLNLLGNAVKFTEEGGVSLRAEPWRGQGERTGVVFRIADTGPGIAAEAIEAIFAPFAQAGPRIGRLYGGSGLGLLISRRIIDAMGGTIACTSRPGEGSLFEVRVPLEAPPEAALEEGATAAGLAGSALLVIDPQTRSRSTMRELALLWGMEVRTARTCREGLSVLMEAAGRSRPFDLVILDSAAADMQAAEFARRAAGLSGGGHVGLVLLTSSGLRGDAASARAAGFAAYLSKPVTAATLLDCLRQVRGEERGEEALITVHSMAERRGRPLDLLVVDDNALNCRLASIMLERAGHKVTIARSGPAALRLVVHRRFDLVLLDVEMPEMDGLEVTRRIRALGDPSRSGLPIVAVTANAMQEDERRCLEAGMDGYLTKPIDGASLLAAVEAQFRAGSRHAAE